LDVAQDPADAVRVATNLPEHHRRSIASRCCSAHEIVSAESVGHETKPLVEGSRVVVFSVHGDRTDAGLQISLSYSPHAVDNLVQKGSQT
jgi:hypothetical protein